MKATLPIMCRIVSSAAVPDSMDATWYNPWVCQGKRPV